VAYSGSIRNRTWYGVSGSRSQLTVVDSLLSLNLSCITFRRNETKTNEPSKATMKIHFSKVICAVLAILSWTVSLRPTLGAGAPRPFLMSSKSECEPATPIEAAVDNNDDKSNYNKASRDHDSQPTTTTKTTTTAIATTTKVTTTTTSATRMRQQRPSQRRHRSLVFTNLFAWIKKIICYIFGQKFGFCSPSTPTCRTGPTPFTSRQQLDT
jgi:hypothetical protein